MKIALAQLNYHIGNFAENERKITDAIAKAKTEGAKLVVFAKLAIGGGPAEGLLRRPEFLTECLRSVGRIAEHCHGIDCLIGTPIEQTEDGSKKLYNADLIIKDGKMVVGNKNLLSDDDVFDESRYPGTGAESINRGDFLVDLVASPFSPGLFEKRLQTLCHHARAAGRPLVHVNQVGAHADLIFDGRSLVLDRNGNLLAELARFAEDFRVVDISESPSIQPEEEPSGIALVHDALVLGIRDFFGKSGFKKAVLGLSGGLDSAVVAALACQALGAENVLAVLMPSVHSTEHSIKDALDLAENTGCRHETIPIGEIAAAFDATLAHTFRGLAADVTEENLQARIRGTILMAISNKSGHILLNTSNKSEAAVGYGTLYGDMAGALGVIGDVYKTQVYALAGYINCVREIIPANTITKPPSAELRPGQKDSDSLPPYDVLDAVLHQLIEAGKPVSEVVEAGFDEALVRRVAGMLHRSEFKRFQAPPILRVSRRAFGSGWNMPLVNGFCGFRNPDR